VHYIVFLEDFLKGLPAQHTCIWIYDFENLLQNFM